MNFLAHLALSGNEPEILVGNLMGDFVKGRLGGRYSGRLLAGLELHRKIDSFAENHPGFVRSKRRLDSSLGHYRGILVDLFFDHFLAREWDAWYGEPLPSFISAAEETARRYAALLPARLQQLLPAIFGEWLPVYEQLAGIDLVLVRMARRVGGSNPLAAGSAELRRHYRELQDDFRSFYPDACTFAAAFIAERAALDRERLLSPEP